MSLERAEVVFFAGIGADISPQQNALLGSVADVVEGLGCDLSVVPYGTTVDQEDLRASFVMGHSLGALPVLRMGGGLVIAPPDLGALHDGTEHVGRLAEYFGNGSSVEGDVVLLRGANGSEARCRVEDLEDKTITRELARRVVAITVEHDKLYPGWRGVYEPEYAVPGASHSLLQPGAITDELLGTIRRIVGQWQADRRC